MASRGALALDIIALEIFGGALREFQNILFADIVLGAVGALRAADVTVAPISDELDRWQIGCFTFSDAELLRLAESRRLVEVA